MYSQSFSDNLKGYKNIPFLAFLVDVVRVIQRASRSLSIYIIPTII